MKKLTKLRLLDTFSQNLQKWFPELDNHFACPLCRRVFEKDSSLNEISGAHLWSQALGGKQETLTCRDCNSKMGTTIESHATNRAKYRRVILGESAETIKISIPTSDGGEVNAQLTNEYDEDRGLNVKKFKTLDRHSNPKHLAQFNEDMQNFGVGSELTFVHRSKTNSRELILTYLHMGYLTMFHYFGYEWVVCPSSTIIREQLFKPKEKLIEPILMQFLPEYSTPNNDEVELRFIYEPVEWIGYFVITPRLAHYGNIRMGVRLPAFTQEYETPSLINARPRFSLPIRLRHEVLRSKEDFRAHGKRLAYDLLKKFNPSLRVFLHQ